LNDSQNPLSAVEPLADHHVCDGFDCGTHSSLNEWLKRYALESQKAKSARTFVVHRNRQVVGYYSLCAASISREEATPRAAKYQPKRPIPAILLPRLAIDKNEQRKDLGKALLKDALLRVLNASNEIGARAVLVHAIDKEAKQFYKRFGFEDCPVNDLHLMLLMKDLEQSLKG
jgi:GNAT superfamily N-acetyltransferase